MNLRGSQYQFGGLARVLRVFGLKRLNRKRCTTSHPCFCQSARSRFETADTSVHDSRSTFPCSMRKLILDQRLRAKMRDLDESFRFQFFFASLCFPACSEGNEVLRTRLGRAGAQMSGKGTTSMCSGPNANEFRRSAVFRIFRNSLWLDGMACSILEKDRFTVIDPHLMDQMNFERTPESW
jgi:hypothetical protein